MTKKIIKKEPIQKEPIFLYEDEVVVISGFFRWIKWKVTNCVFSGWNYEYCLMTDGCNDFNYNYLEESELDFNDNLDLIVLEALYKFMPWYKKLFISKKSFISKSI